MPSGPSAPRKVVVSGPFSLRPKGMGLVARQAIYTQEHFWGLVSVVLDLPPILTESGLDNPPRGTQVALLDRSGRLLSGKKAVLEQNPVSIPIDLPDGSWKLAAIPAEGWKPAVAKPVVDFRGVTLAIVLLVTALVGWAAGYRAQLASAVRQKTETIQRALAERREEELLLGRKLDALRQAMGATLRTLAQAVEAKDPYKAGHHKRVADLARMIALEMGLSDDTLEGIRTAGSLHDIGKIQLPPEILNKPARLTAGEFQQVKAHAQAGHDILEEVEFPWPVARIVAGSTTKDWTGPDIRWGSKAKTS